MPGKQIACTRGFKGDPTVRLDTDDFKPPVVRILVARGHDFSQLVFHLEKEVITIGRDPNSDLVIQDESVSRKHAKLRRFNDRWIVQDLGSLNGTFVSYSGDPQLERRIERENALKNGSVLRFGQASYTILLNE
jgi:pSer/pThr/pTyr-binding forkhead associated (FHA) protein